MPWGPWILRAIDFCASRTFLSRSAMFGECMCTLWLCSDVRFKDEVMIVLIRSFLPPSAFYRGLVSVFNSRWLLQLVSCVSSLQIIRALEFFSTKLGSDSLLLTIELRLSFWRPREGYLSILVLNWDENFFSWTGNSYFFYLAEADWFDNFSGLSLVKLPATCWLS